VSITVIFADLFEF